MRAIGLSAAVLAIALPLLAVGCKPDSNAQAQAPANKAVSGGVPQGPPNKADAVPAFAGQTRAPEVKSAIKLKTQVFKTGINKPWAMAFLPDGQMLVTSQTGSLWLVTQGGAKSEIKGAPKVDTHGQGGLLDVSIAPDFATSRNVYLTFAEPRSGGNSGTSLARGKLSADNARLEGVSVIFQQLPAFRSDNHYGSNMEWDSAGNLYLTLGERYEVKTRNMAQTLDNHMGKVVRLTADGKAAPGNPFASQAGAKPEIWSLGHRNVQGAAINPATGKLWTIEHGPRGGDELNIPEPGKNYGWPTICYCIDYPGGPIGKGITAQAGLEQPLYYWDPVIAPGDMTFYKGDLFPWKGNILASSLAGAMVRLELAGDKVTGEERLLADVGRIRDITEAPDGALWLVVNDDDGEIVRVTPG